MGEDSDRAEMLGLNVNALRIKAMILSTVIACLGQIFYVQNIGMLGVYSAHKIQKIFPLLHYWPVEPLSRKPVSGM